MHVDRWLDIEVIEVDRHVPSQLVVRLRERDRDADPVEAADEEVAR
jgi:hypothetical protein